MFLGDRTRHNLNNQYPTECERERTMKFAQPTLILAACLTASSQAALFTPGLVTDYDPPASPNNDTRAGADAIGALVLADSALPTTGGNGWLTSGDADWYLLELEDTSPEFLLTVTTTPLVFLAADPDTTLGLFGTTGGGSLIFPPIVTDDDSGFGVGSAFQLTVTPGDYYITVSGKGDMDFDGKLDTGAGDHTEHGQYSIQVIVEPVPEPASAALAAIGSIVIFSRRRKN